MLLGGDFRQTANVVMRGTRNDTVEASIKCSYLWEHVTTYKLSKNMRCQGQSEFTNWLLQVGEGTINDINDRISIPRYLIVNHDIVKVMF